MPSKKQVLFIPEHPSWRPPYALAAQGKDTELKLHQRVTSRIFVWPFVFHCGRDWDVLPYFNMNSPMKQKLWLISLSGWKGTQKKIFHRPCTYNYLSRRGMDSFWLRMKSRRQGSILGEEFILRKNPKWPKDYIRRRWVWGCHLTRTLPLEHISKMFQQPYKITKIFPVIPKQKHLGLRPIISNSKLYSLIVQ